MDTAANVTKPKVIALMGPTASGKTRLAIHLRREIGAEIISVDSTLVYRGMDIGSAKPTPTELDEAPHRLIDICDPSESYSVADFCRDAEREIEAVIAQGKTPLLVGGSMLYFRALLNGLSPMPDVSPTIRAQLHQEGDTLGWPVLHQRLMAVDPELAVTLHPNHSHRISRALEVYIASGKTMSAWRAEAGRGLLSRFDWRQIALMPTDRASLHHAIEHRFDTMLAQGLVDEVQRLYQRGDLSPDLPALRAVGYRQVWQFLAGELAYDDMRAKTLAASRQLAKRQLTWLRSWPDIIPINSHGEIGSKRTDQEILLKCLRYIG